MYHVYILKSLKDHGYYFGHTNNTENRLKKHNSGQVSSTKYRSPWILHYVENYPTKSEAFRREMYFKSAAGRNWLISQEIILPGSRNTSR